MIKKYKKISIGIVLVLIFLSPLFFLTYEIEGRYENDKGVKIHFRKGEVDLYGKIVAEYKPLEKNKWQIKANWHPHGYIEEKRINGYAVRSLNSLELYLEGSENSMKFTQSEPENIFSYLLKKWKL